MYMRLECQALTIFDTKKVFQKRLICCFHQKKNQSWGFPRNNNSYGVFNVAFQLVPFHPRSTIFTHSVSWFRTIPILVLNIFQTIECREHQENIIFKIDSENEKNSVNRKFISSWKVPQELMIVKVSRIECNVRTTSYEWMLPFS